MQRVRALPISKRSQKPRILSYYLDAFHYRHFGINDSRARGATQPRSCESADDRGPPLCARSDSQHVDDMPRSPLVCIAAAEPMHRIGALTVTGQYHRVIDSPVCLCCDSHASYVTNPKELTMSSTQIRSETGVANPRARKVDLKLEVVVIPVSDVERAKRFYGGAWAGGSTPTSSSVTTFGGSSSRLPVRRARSNLVRGSRRPCQARHRDSFSSCLTSRQRAPSSSIAMST